MQFKKIGQNVKIYPLAKILNPEVISIGNNVIIDNPDVTEGVFAQQPGGWA